VPARRRSIFRRAGRRTNLALLILLVGAFGSGWVAFGFGTPAPATVTTLAHGLFGLGTVVLVPWKSMVIRRAPVLHVASLVLAAVIIICLVAGFVEVFGGYGIHLGVSPIQVHVGAALVAVPLVVVHLLRHRQRRLSTADLSRRNLLRSASFVAGIGAAYVTLEGLGALAGSASADRVATGSHRLPPRAVPATIWLFDRVPELAVDHRVVVAGSAFSAVDLDARGTQVQARLDCTSGWYADATWTAVSLAELIPGDRLGRASSIEVVSVTGYRRRFPANEAATLWLATRFEGARLSAGSGAPVRLVAPGRRGFWWVKWVATVRLSEQPAYAQLPFPPQ
jgi:hypothetical protein